MMGATDPKKSAPGTIRGDLAIALGENVIHGSDSPASAERELAALLRRRPAALSDPAPAARPRLALAAAAGAPDAAAAAVPRRRAGLRRAGAPGRRRPSWCGRTRSRRRAPSRPRPVTARCSASTRRSCWTTTRVLGKPPDAAAARAMLARLAGRAAPRAQRPRGARRRPRAGRPRARPSSASAPLTADEIDAYVASGEWQGRAGGYAIQGLGAGLVTGIDGDYANVVGLPVALLVATLADARVSRSLAGKPPAGG